MGHFLSSFYGVLMYYSRLVSANPLSLVMGAETIGLHHFLVQFLSLYPLIFSFTTVLDIVVPKNDQK